ncbi:MAG: AraC family transcriptional regulator [Ilumatobacteraceae bacterium]
MTNCDPLAEVLRIIQVRGAVMARVVAGDTWGLAIGQIDGVAMHAVTAGTCWLRVVGEAHRQLFRGDVVLLPHGTPHELASSPRGPTTGIDRLAKRQLMSPAGELSINVDPTSPTTRFLCASYSFDHDVSHRLVSLLPTVIHLSGDETDDGIRSALRMLATEVRLAEPGSATAIDRLLDVVFVHALRAQITSTDISRSSWLTALADPMIAQSLTALHDQPDRHWTTTGLARAVGASRATLARRFSEHVGQPPMQYLAEWRMDLAAQALRDTGRPIDVIARQVGYTSEFAFSRAFSRHLGVPPGRYRRGARAVDPTAPCDPAALDGQIVG